MNPRDLPEIVAELIIEMHEVRSELRLVREEARQNTDRLIEAFGRSMEPLINRLLDHEARLRNLENPAE